MKMKRMLALLLSAAILLLSGCSSPQIPPAAFHDESGDIISDAVDTSRNEGVTTFGLAYQSKFGLNPYSCTNLTNRTILSLLYESLFTVTSNFEVEPVLCDYYDVSDDLKEYTIHLMPGVQFCDGTPLRAEDVAASYRAAINSDVYGKRFYAVSSIEALDEETVQFKTTIPYENLTLLLDIPIVSADSVDSASPMGTGPYRMIAERYTNTLVRNGYWWQESHDAAVSVTSIRLVPTETPTDVRDDFEYGVTGVVCTDPNSAAYVDYHCDYELWNCSTTIMGYIGFNIKSGLFSQTELRAALTNIIDRDTIATEIYHGYAEAAMLPASPLSIFYDSTLAEQYDYSPNKFSLAVAATSARGSNATFLVCSSDPSRVAAAEFIAAEVEKYGIELVVDAVNERDYRNRLKNGLFDLYFGEARLSPTFDLSPFFNDNGLCYGGIFSGDLTDLCYDSLENSGNYYNLHAAVMDNGMLCPVLFKSYAVYASRGTITNMYPAVDNVFHTSNGRTLSDAILAEPEAADAQPSGEGDADETSEADEPDETGETSEPDETGEIGDAEVSTESEEAQTE